MNNKIDGLLLVISIAAVLIEWRTKHTNMKSCAFAEHAGIEARQYKRYEEGVNMTILSLIKTLNAHERPFLDFWIAVYEKYNERQVKKDLRN